MPSILFFVRRGEFGKASKKPPLWVGHHLLHHRTACGGGRGGGGHAVPPRCPQTPAPGGFCSPCPAWRAAGRPVGGLAGPSPGAAGRRPSLSAGCLSAPPAAPVPPPPRGRLRAPRPAGGAVAPRGGGGTGDARAAGPPAPVNGEQLPPRGAGPAPRPPHWLPMTSPPRRPAGRPRLPPRPAARRRVAIGRRDRPSPPAPPPPGRTFTR